jgi:signal transduction histidine kinase
MSSVAVSEPTRVDDGELQQGFARFVTAAAELERSYAALQARAAAVDLELQATNRALQESLAEREAIFAALPIGLLLVEPDGAARCCNQEAQRLVALAGRQLDLARCAPGEVVLDGGLVRVRRVALASGELVLLEDRSRVQELEREVHRLDRLAGLSELALGIAHEIKNPLNGVMGFAALLERDPHGPDAVRHAQRIGRGVRQVDEICRALLGFARPARGGERLAPLHTVLGAAARSAGLPAGRLQLVGDGELAVDADALERVVAILMRNAIEAAPAVRVTVTAAARHGRLELVVRDDGPGLPADLGKRILEPFVSTKDRGTGLGLPLAVRVLSFLGGELEPLFDGGPGAAFRLRMPLARPASRAAAVGATS